MSKQRGRAFGTRLDDDLIIEVKIAAAIQRKSMQEIIDEAVREWLQGHTHT